MKYRHIFIVVLMILLVSSPALAQRKSHALVTTEAKESNATESTQENKPQDDGPSLQETLDWLKGKFGKGAGFIAAQDFSSAQINGPGSYRISFDRCMLIWKRDSVTLLINLADLDLQKVEANGQGGSWTVDLGTTNGKWSILWEDETWFGRPDRQGDKKSFHLNAVYFFTEDEEMSNRIAKAFRHAIKLCKEKEPF